MTLTFILAGKWLSSNWIFIWSGLVSPLIGGQMHLRSKWTNTARCSWYERRWGIHLHHSLSRCQFPLTKSSKGWYGLFSCRQVQMAYWSYCTDYQKIWPKTALLQFGGKSGVFLTAKSHVPASWSFSHRKISAMNSCHFTTPTATGNPFIPRKVISCEWR